MLTCTVTGLRTHHTTGSVVMTQVTFARFGDRLDIIKGGVTSEESWHLEDFPWNFDRRFSICVGTRGRYDALQIPGLSMATVYLNLVKNVGDNDEIDQPMPEHLHDVS